MNFIFFNVKGIVNTPSKLALKMLILNHKSQFVFILELWNVAEYAWKPLLLDAQCMCLL